MVLSYVLIFIFGTIIGSFLNVVILRYNTGFSIVKGGSKCFLCGHKLRWFELIPILSFAAQKGRCRECGAKISWQYPIVEFLTGLLFILVFSKQYSVPITIYYLLIVSLLIIIAVYDFRHQIIPNGIVYAFDILAFLNLLEIRNLKLEIFSWDGFLTGIVFFAFFGALWLISKGTWMGLGDAKLALGIGWMLGLSKGIWAMLFSFWIGAIVGVALLFLQKKRYNLKSKIAFGPFLVLGAMLAFIFL